MDRFLILDPHYTGKDDLKTILDKVCRMSHDHMILVSCAPHHFRVGVPGNHSSFGTALHITTCVCLNSLPPHSLL